MGVKLTIGVFQNVWSNTSILPYPSGAQCLMKHRDMTPTVRLYVQIVIKCKFIYVRSV
jgi:hypothetical protein